MMMPVDWSDDEENNISVGKSFADPNQFKFPELDETNTTKSVNDRFDKRFNEEVDDWAPIDAGMTAGAYGGSDPDQSSYQQNTKQDTNISIKEYGFPKHGERRSRHRGRENGQDGEEAKRKENFTAVMYIPPVPTNDENEIFAAGITSGINFNNYEKIPVKVSGQDIPKPIKSFQDSGINLFIQNNIMKSGYKIPTPVQKHAIPIVLANRDLMACAQTGSGKSAAFLIPIIDTIIRRNVDVIIGKPFALILVPTRELSIQVSQEARKFSMGLCITITNIYGGTAVQYQSKIMSSACHILVATPGRLLDFMDRKLVSFEELRFLILDEADRMLDMGFISDVKKIVAQKTLELTKDCRTLMFSATFPKPIQQLAGEFLDNYIFLTVGVVGGACNDVSQHFLEIIKFKKREKLIQILRASDPRGTMVFVETKRTADFLATYLSEARIPTTSIHGDRYQRERELALNDFKSGKMLVLIATSVAARGLDIKNVAHVINYDLPNCINDYVHRIGRTGRLGNCGKSTSFYDPHCDEHLSGDLLKTLEQSQQPIAPFLAIKNLDLHSKRLCKFPGKDCRSNNPVNNELELAALEPEEEW